MVGDMWQLGALLREASCILSEGFSLLLLAFAEVPRVAESYVGSFEVALKHPDQIGPIVNLVGRELLKPSAGGVGEEERQLSDDGSIVPSGASKLTGQPEICQPELWLGLAVVLCNAGRGLNGLGSGMLRIALLNTLGSGGSGAIRSSSLSYLAPRWAL